GPGGGTPQKPVGTVCLAWGLKDGEARAETRHFPGDREAVRRQSVVHALEVLIGMLEAVPAAAKT
ncbi:MAG: CinA-related protein, partial [Betaproteobacteria bacterium]|nr:CinA-related protein [Betaproteobacteria bacterium]